MHRETCNWTVKVENIPKNVNLRDVVSIFRSTVGEAQCQGESHISSHGGSVELSFSSHDRFRKALCMSGYNIFGTSIIVAPITTSKLHSRMVSKGLDTRRNLYVLGLPFDLTKAEFSGLFSRYGTVHHTVILATVDSASRRRGFVVMSTHEEAEMAMNALSRTQMKGYIIDVSWAVVQRSQGFLDGEDRSMMLSTPMPNALPDMDTRIKLVMPTTPSHEEHRNLRMTLLPATKLLVTRLPMLLFSQPEDLRPLFCPFGEIQSMHVLERSTNDLQSGTISAVVEYTTVTSAREAKETLQAQLYGNIAVDVQYMQESSPLVEHYLNIPQHYGRPILTESKAVASSLNPYATPFVLNDGSAFSVHPSFFQDHHHASDVHEKNKFIPRGLPANMQYPPTLAPPYFSSNLAYRLSQHISRSSSATSSSRSIDSHPAIPSRLLGDDQVRASDTTLNPWF